MGVNSQHGANTITLAYVDMDKVLGDFLKEVEALGAARWAMGDLADRLHTTLNTSPTVRQQFASQGITMAGFARKVGLTPRQLEALRLASATFPAKERHPGLSWEHHHMLARLTAHDSSSARRKWLREAGKQHWSPHQLAHRVRPPATMPEASIEEKVHTLRRQLAEAEAELAIRREGVPSPRKQRRQK